MPRTSKKEKKEKKGKILRKVTYLLQIILTYILTVLTSNPVTFRSDLS